MPKTARTGVLTGLAAAVSRTRAEAAQQGTPVYGRTDPAAYNEYTGCHEGAGTVRIGSVLDHTVFKTMFHAVSRGRIPPKTSIGEHVHRHMEEMFIILNAPAEFTVDGATALLPAGACVPCLMGHSHGVYNPHDDIDLEWLYFAVTERKGVGDAVDFGEDLSAKRLVSPPPFPWTCFDGRLLKMSGPAHRGAGEIGFRRLYNKDTFKTTWEFLDHCVLPPGTSIGYHQHNMIEEVYYIVSGSGLMTVNDTTWEVGPGDAIPCTLGDSHGLYNSGTGDILLVVCSCAVEKGRRNTNNWGDDLTSRTPGG